MLLNVAHLRGLADEETVDAVVLRRFAAGIVDAAAGDDLDVGALADEEIVVDHVVHAAFRDDDGNVHLLRLGKRHHADVDAGLVGLWFDLHRFGRAARDALAVLADVVRADRRHVGDVRDAAEKSGKQFVHHCAASSFPRNPQSSSNCPRSPGNTSSRLPRVRIFPSATTSISSASCMMRS